MTTYQKAAAWAIVQALFAGCSAGGSSNGGDTPNSPSPAPSSATSQNPVVHITSQPANASVAEGSTATFSVHSDDVGATYQWYRGDTAIPGAVFPSYTTPPTTSADNGVTFSVKVTNSGGSVTSTVATLSVASTSTPAPSPGPTSAPTPSPTPSPAPGPSPAPAPSAPAITAQPANAAVQTGATATFSVSATGSPSYQWKRNGVAIVGATGATYTAPPASYVDQGAAFTVTVTNANGSVTSTPGVMTLVLSADQQLYETFALAPASSGSYELDWDLYYVGPQNATNYVVYDYAALSASPLTGGPQQVRQQPEAKIATTLGVPPVAPTRILKNGTILVVPNMQQLVNVSYVGSGIRVDNIANDNTTVAYSQIRSGYSVVPLSGLLHSAPTQITHPYNSIFANPVVLDTTTSWLPGAAYMVYTGTNLGDRYNVFDCHFTTTDANVSPCQSGITLAAAMAAGETSTSDGVTYHSADGRFGTLGTVPIWIATGPRPATPSGAAAYTVEYRIYFELNGNVYTGALIKDGTVEGTHHYRTDPNDVNTTVYLDYEMRLNLPAVQSLVAGSLL
jgi:hypothetical protein